MDRNFVNKLNNAEIKLRRCDDAGYDPISGHTADDIVDYIVNLPELGNREQVRAAQAVLRRNDRMQDADAFFV